MHARVRDRLLDSLADASNEVAEDEALLFSEGVPDIPTLEELRELSRKTVFRERNRLLGQKGGA